MIRGALPLRVALCLLVVLVGLAAATAPLAATGSSPTAAGQPTLPTTPVVNLKVGVLPLSAFGSYYIAQERGYFRDVGLNVEFEVATNVNELLPSLAQGQLHISAC